MSITTECEGQSTSAFENFAISTSILKGIEQAQYQQASPIQTQFIPMALQGRDIIGQAQSGSGKTAAFIIPALQLISETKRPHGDVLVLVPTRELCRQVAEEFEKLGRFCKLHVTQVIGQESYFRQIEQVNRGSHVIVATPGRMLDHLKSKKLKKFNPKMVILDEADEMLDMGFIDDLKKILTFTDPSRQTLLLSATMPPPIAKLAKKEMKDPKHIRLTDQEIHHQDIEQYLFMLKPEEKDQALLRLIDADQPQKAVVFCQTRADAANICDRLLKKGIRSIPLHGDLNQRSRHRAVADFKRGQAGILVATDLAARGLDVDDLTHVFNYHVADTSQKHTHRVGRTGRAGRKGKALTLATREEFSKHHYLRQAARAQRIQLAEIPSRQTVQSQVEAHFFQTIAAHPVDADSQEICDKYVGQDQAFEFLQKMFSHIRQDITVGGPDQLGFRVDDVLQWQKRAKPNPSSRPRKKRRFQGRKKPPHRPSRNG